MLTRRAPMRRTALVTRSTPKRAKARTPRPRRDTGPSKAVKDELAARAGGRCEVAGCSLVNGFSRHHRRPRAAGGSRRADTNELTNLLLVCGTATSGCHQQIETNRDWALAHGYLVRQSHDPATIPVMYRGVLVLLNTDGTTTPAKEVP